MVHYDHELPIILTTDDSNIGVGAFIAHQFPHGTELPTAYASGVLSDFERRYSTIEHETLAIVFGLQKFQQFLLGRKYILKTDYKPFEVLFGHNAQLPQLAANRIDRWSVLLTMYNYEIKYISGTLNHTADMLSRLPGHDEASTIEREGMRNHLLHLRIRDSSVSPKELKRHYQTDEIIQRVIRLTQH